MQERERANRRLCIVVPCFNEAEALPVASSLMVDKLASLAQKGLVAADSSVLFVDDGSQDDTWRIIEGLARDHDCCEGLKLSRNQGHQNALLAGLMAAREDYDLTITIDCDGQDDMDAMDKMIAAYLEGDEVVYGVRSSRKVDTFFKRFTAESFYRLLNAMGVEAVFNHADYRLLSSKALEALAQFKEVNLFLRGMVPLLGFSSSQVDYERRERIAGKSHYPFAKMMGLALDGITSLSIKPIRIITWMGFIMAVLSLVGIIWAVVMHLTGNTITGWASMLCAVLFIGGLQLIALGVIGEYVGRIYLEAKGRPRYIVEKTTLGSQAGKGRQAD